MGALVCGQNGQRVVRRVGLVPSQGTDSVITRSLLAEDKTALETLLRQRVAKLRHVRVRKKDLYNKLIFDVFSSLTSERETV